MGADRITQCAHHPDRASVEQFGNLPLCEECQRGRAEAARVFAPSVPHAACCVERRADGRWVALRECAPAHWVAHELRTRAQPPAAACAFGHPLKLQDLLRTRRPIAGRVPLGTGDLWVDLDGSRCGLVIGIDRGDTLRVMIRHLDPERQAVLVVDFYEAFDGRGDFHR